LPSFYSKENYKSGSSFLFHRLIFSLRKHLANQLIAFAALRLHRFAGRLPGDFTFTLSAFPPFKEVGSGAIVPDVLFTGSIQRDEPPNSVGVANLLDDANLLFRRH